ncbi:hypothetical protein Indivirus_1_215 [Indivirus ILV1]|uniref:Uncharacterized protein n=1 Tax=Indivirus ILV1 TaxID=1977633 RepID=A0A1V0SD11_9VIRU|nr:hypothetical protein Indivirus_1_215 [Indivirus ILV1]
MSDFEKVWKLLKIFSKPYVNITNHRNYLIKKIPKKFTIEEFYICEKIIDNMFWDLREKLGNKTCCNFISYENSSDLDEKLYYIYENIGTFYRSFINKLIIVDKENKKIYYKKMDGSSIIFNGSNKFNLLTLTILFNRELYENVMNGKLTKKEIKNIELPNYYYQLDYCFPNLNCCHYNIGTKDDWIERIRKMYYNKNAEYWYKLII